MECFLWENRIDSLLTTDGLQESTDLLMAHYCSHARLRINAKNTKCMAVSKSASQRPYNENDCRYLAVQMSR